MFSCTHGFDSTQGGFTLKLQNVDSFHRSSAFAARVTLRLLLPVPRGLQGRKVSSFVHTTTVVDHSAYQCKG